MNPETKAKEQTDPSRPRQPLWSSSVEEYAEQVLDQLVGEAHLEGVRLAKVLRMRANLLAGSQRDLVLSFARNSDCQGDRRGQAL